MKIRYPRHQRIQFTITSVKIGTSVTCPTLGLTTEDILSSLSSQGLSVKNNVIRREVFEEDDETYMGGSSFSCELESAK